MKVLIIEDSNFKRMQLEMFLGRRLIDYEVFKYLNSALKYIMENKDEISGIILDLGLQNFKDSLDTYSDFRGMDLIYEFKRTGIEIPVLINSTTIAKNIDEYQFVFGQRTEIDDYHILEEFITFLKEKQ